MSFEQPSTIDIVEAAEHDYLDALADFGVDSAEAVIAKYYWRELLRQRANAARPSIGLRPALTPSSFQPNFRMTRQERQQRPR